MFSCINWSQKQKPHVIEIHHPFFFVCSKVKEMELQSPEMKLGGGYGSCHRFRTIATSWCFWQLKVYFRLFGLVFCILVEHTEVMERAEKVVLLLKITTLLLNMSVFILLTKCPLNQKFTQQNKFDTGLNFKLAIWTGKVAGCRWVGLGRFNPCVRHTGALLALQSSCIM